MRHKKWKKPLDEKWIDESGISFQVSSTHETVTFTIEDGDKSLSFKFDSPTEYRKCISRFIDRFSTLDGLGG